MNSRDKAQKSQNGSCAFCAFFGSRRIVVIGSARENWDIDPQIAPIFAEEKHPPGFRAFVMSCFRDLFSNRRILDSGKWCRRARNGITKA
jgi:hypothetical protein